MRASLATLALAAIVLCPAAAAGADAAEAPLPAVESFPTPLAAPMWRVGLTLAGLSAVSGALAFWARRRRRALGGTDAEIRILANRSLSSRHQVVLLDVGGRRLLVGTGGEAVTMLADLSEAEPFASALDRHAPTRDHDPAQLGTIGRFEGLDA